MRTFFVASGSGILSISILTLYAIYTKHTTQEIAWAMGATSALGLCVFLLGLAVGRKRRAG